MGQRYIFLIILPNFALENRSKYWKNKEFGLSLPRHSELFRRVHMLFEVTKTEDFPMTLVFIILIVVAILLALTGIVGAIVPALPGPPLCWGSLLVAYFACPSCMSDALLWSMLALTILSQVLDYVAPIWMAKAGGGSKAAITGSTVGLLLGLFFMPTGLFLGPLLGAFAGEMMSTHDSTKAFRMALLSFLSFLLSTSFKLILCLIMTFYTMSAFWERILQI